MHQYAQRRHIIRSLDRLCYQLFVVSFFLAPSLLQLLARSTSQFQFSRPRDLDSERSLKFWLFIIFCANTGSLLNHVMYRTGAGVGKGVVLDFIGMANLPSKTELLILDALIIFLQIILVCISYETSLAMALPVDTIDPLLPDNIDDDESAPSKYDRHIPVLHLRLRHTVRRVIDPAPVVPSSSGSTDIPLPNTTPFVFPSASFPIQIAFRTRARAPDRRDSGTNTALDSGGTDDSGNSEETTGAQNRTVPGGLDVG